MDEHSAEGNDELLTAQEVAEMLKIDEHTLYKWRTDGKNLPYYKLGPNPKRPLIRYLRSDVREYVGQGRVDLKREEDD